MATVAAAYSTNQYFFQQLSNACRGVLALDYDRTIGRLGAASGQRFPCVSVREVLGSILATTDVRIVLVGRTGTFHLINRIAPWSKLQKSGAEFAFNVHSEDLGASYRGDNNANLAQVFSKLSETSPLVYITTPDLRGKEAWTRWSRSGHLIIRPQFFLRDAKSWYGEPEDIRQFLIDWVRACGGELC